MMQRYVGPQVVIAALVGALHQAGCTVDEGGSSPGSRLAADVEPGESPGDGDDPGDHPGDGDHDDDGGDGGDHDDDGGDGGDHGDDDGGDGGDGGETCPFDPCEGTTGTDLYVASDCDTLYPFDVSTEFTCAGARERCEQLAQDDPSRSIQCEWGRYSIEVFRQEVEPEACDFFGPPPPTEGPCEPRPPRCEIPCGDGGPGSYSGFYCGPDGEPFVHTEGIDCQVALGDCALHAALNPDKDIVCEFNGQEIFRRELNESACVPVHGEPTVDCDLPLPELCEGTHPCLSDGTALYVGSFCDGGRFIRSPNGTCQGALGNCILNASLNLTRSIRCQWNDQEIYRNELEEGVCQEFDPVCEAPSP